MKYIIVISLLCVSSALFAQSYESGKVQQWNDLTGVKYNGKDVDLSGFKIYQPDVSCDSLLRKCAITWNNSTERRLSNCKKSCDQRLQEYEIFFEVRDRKNNFITVKNVKWNLDITTPQKGYVGAYKRFIELGNVPLDYTTVNYWVQGIKWKGVQVKNQESDKQAFTIEEMIKAGRKAQERDDNN